MSLFKSNLTNAAANVLAAPVVVPQVLSTDDMLTMSSALVPAVPVHVEGMLRPFQDHQAAAYLYATESIRRYGWFIAGYDMGLGKTQLFLALIADAIRNGGYALLIGPPVGKGGYMNDIRKAFPSLRFAHLYGRNPERDNEGNPIVPPADVYFLSDDALTLKAWLVDHEVPKALPALNSFASGASIFVRDEIQRDKGNLGKHTARAKVSHALGNAMRLARRPVIAATGTLTTNRPIDALLPLQIVGDEQLVLDVTPGARKVSGFLFRYCDPKQVDAGRNGIKHDFSGTSKSNVLVLHEMLRRFGYGRVERRDVLGLPDGGWLVVPLALNGVMARYRALSNDFLRTVMAEKGPEAMWRAQSAEALTQMQALWSEAGAAKAPAAVEYVMNLVDQGRKVIVFYSHDLALAGLRQGFTDAKVKFIEINGHCTGNKRMAGIEAFQDGTDTMVCLAQTQAAGMSVTLTAAADAVYVQLPWSAGDLAQSAARNLRSDDISRARALAGENVTWHVLVARHEDGSETIDDTMWDVLAHKAQVVDAINAGKAITMPDATVHKMVLQAWYDQAVASASAA